MTIKAGEPWGRRAIVGDDALTCRSDDELARGIGDCIVVGGDLWLALGCPSPPQKGQPCTRVDVDLLVCAVDTGDGTRVVRAASHVRVGSWLRPGRFVCATNAGYVNRRNIAPRAHPNDGLIHVFELNRTMAWRERVIARHRALSGTHVPHPAITLTRRTEWGMVREGVESLVIDNIRIHRWNSVMVTVNPDGMKLLI